MGGRSCHDSDQFVNFVFVLIIINCQRCSSFYCYPAPIHPKFTNDSIPGLRQDLNFLCFLADSFLQIQKGLYSMFTKNWRKGARKGFGSSPSLGFMPWQTPSPNQMHPACVKWLRCVSEFSSDHPVFLAPKKGGSTSFWENMNVRLGGWINRSEQCCS